MSTGTQPAARTTTNGATGEFREWRDHARVFLQPIAAPSILGLYGFAAATEPAGWSTAPFDLGADPGRTARCLVAEIKRL